MSRPRAPYAPPIRRHSSPTSPQSRTPSMDDNGVAPPPPPPPSRAPSLPVREDCWSEDATFTLIKAWGDRYIQLNRGNLRQKHWQEVADGVNARHAHTRKARRTDIQCKNRIDTLKKKYKVEKSKVLELGFDRYLSPWPFFEPIDSLIGFAFKPSSPPRRKRVQSLPPPPSSVPVGPRSKRPYNPSPPTDSCDFRRNFSAMAAAAAAIEAAEEDSGTSSGGRRPEEVDGCRELAVAIGRFAEVYERVEEAKQRQMVELEKQRMQFTKDLELQRMKLLMESQIQLEKFTGSKRILEPDFYRCNDGDGDGDGDQSGSMS